MIHELLQQASTCLYSIKNAEFHYIYLPITIFSLFHALRVALNIRSSLAKRTPDNPDIPWLQGIIGSLTLGLGGSICTSIVFGSYVPWLASNMTLPLYR